MNQQHLMDNENQVVEATNSNEEVVVEETKDTTEEETVETPAEKTYSEKEFKQVLARAKKAEEALKKIPPANNFTNSPSDELIEEKVLLSQGMDAELLKELKAIAKVRGKGLIESQNDPIFVALKKSKEDDEKAKKSKLGASKGSGTVKKEKTINSPGLTEEEHKALWRESMGR